MSRINELLPTHPGVSLPKCVPTRTVTVVDFNNDVLVVARGRTATRSATTSVHGKARVFDPDAIEDNEGDVAGALAHTSCALNLHGRDARFTVEIDRRPATNSLRPVVYSLAPK